MRPRESKTATLSSFRLYAGADAKVLGARPFSLALYGEEGKPARLSLIFVNKGDAGGVFEQFTPTGVVLDKKAQKALTPGATCGNAAIAFWLVLPILSSTNMHRLLAGFFAHLWHE